MLTFLQVSELLCHVAADHPGSNELVRLLQCHHFKVRFSCNFWTGRSQTSNIFVYKKLWESRIISLRVGIETNVCSSAAFYSFTVYVRRLWTRLWGHLRKTQMCGKRKHLWTDLR